MSNLSSIGHLAALERLDVAMSVAERNRLRAWDMSRLSGLRNLTELVLSGCPVVNTAPLADMTGLVTLHLPHALATDLEPLANLTRLEDLDLSGNVVADLGFLAALTNL
ncbi:MAG: leucine-rich repeat domain-containing protein, partial [Gammaproteobacteria bacterium]|nr:leucine-rich repeat domain-containing protein [Gammaproteobacteria bacterium]